MVRNCRGRSIQTYPIPIDEKDCGKTILESLGTKYVYHKTVNQIYQIGNSQYIKGKLQIEIKLANGCNFVCYANLLEAIIE